MLGWLIGSYFGVSTPAGKFFRNVLTVLAFLSFYYWMICTDGESPFEGVVNRVGEDLQHFKTIEGVKVYGIFLLFTIWQGFKWFNKSKAQRKVVPQSITMESKQEVKQVSKQNDNDKIDPTKAMFASKVGFLERYIRGV